MRRRGRQGKERKNEVPEHAQRRPSDVSDHEDQSNAAKTGAGEEEKRLD